MSRNPKKILVLGSGGREHALCWHLQKMNVDVECAPGSDAIAETILCWPFQEFTQLLSEIKKRKIELVIVGPEKYLAEGVTDFLQKEGVSVFGPTRQAAQLESSKSFAKSFCERNGIPQARSRTLTSANDFKKALSEFPTPYVVKASGLAAGKGVWIGTDPEEGLKFATEALQLHDSIVIEEFIAGEELSFFALVDGEMFSILGAAQDHKRLLENDGGPNTGGMGSYSPVPILTAELQSKIVSQILRPTLEGLKKENIFYRGFLFLGLMLKEGRPYLLEYNCRMGDPETQVLMLRLESSLLDLIESLHGKKPMKAVLSPEVALNVVVAAAGYPEKPEQGFKLPGIENAPEESIIFHSGTAKVGEEWQARGGRLFSVATRQKDLFRCQQVVYPWLESLNFLNKVTYRKDIAVRAYRHLVKN